MRLGNYWTVMDDTVILGCAPLGMLGIPQKLHDLNVRGVINMCNEFSGPEKAYERLGMKQLRLPTDDHFEPNVRCLCCMYPLVDCFPFIFVTMCLFFIL